MSRARDLSAKVFAQRVNEAVYIFNGITPGDGAASTMSTKDVEDNLRAKGYVNGREFRWLSPSKLQVQDSAIDRDILDSIQSRGGKEGVDVSTGVSYYDDDDED